MIDEMTNLDLVVHASNQANNLASTHPKHAELIQELALRLQQEEIKVQRVTAKLNSAKDALKQICHNDQPSVKP